MDAVIFYVSVHQGNTRQVARAMAGPLGAKLVDIQSDEVANIDDYDLLGFGSGIYYGKHHKLLLNFVSELPAAKGKKSFIFSTSGMRKIPLVHNFSRRLRKKLEEKKFEIKGEFSCRGYDTYSLLKHIGDINKNHPNKKDLQKAENFAKNLKQKCKD